MYLESDLKKLKKEKEKRKPKKKIPLFIKERKILYVQMCFEYAVTYAHISALEVYFKLTGTLRFNNINCLIHIMCVVCVWGGIALGRRIYS